MKKFLRLLSLAVLVAFTLPSMAQEKKMFTPADASYNNRSLYAQRPNQLKWIGNSEIMMQVKDKEIVTMMPGSKKEATFLTVDELNGYTKGEGVNDLMRIPQLTWINDYQAYFYALGDNGITLNKMDIKKKTIDAVTSIPQGAENQTISKPTLNVAYTTLKASLPAKAFTATSSPSTAASSGRPTANSSPTTAWTNTW